MEKRFFLALVLTALVLIVLPRLYSGISRQRQPARGPQASQDSGRRGGASSAADSVRPSSIDSVRLPPTAVPVQGRGRADTVSVRTDLARFAFSSVDATLLDIELTRFRSLARAGRAVQLARDSMPLLQYRLVAGTDTIPFALGTMRRDSTGAVGDSLRVRYSGTVGPAVVWIEYRVLPHDYVIRVAGGVTGVSGIPVRLLVDLPPGIRSEEADSVEDHRYLAVAHKPAVGDAERVSFDDLDPGQQLVKPDKLTWVVVKNKYFLVGVLRPEGKAPFEGLRMVGGPRTSRSATTVYTTLVEPITDGGFEFEVYAGPQEYRRLLAMGRDFHNANPYGGWLQGVVQPFATIVMQILLWMRETFKLNYGWVLVIFGVGIRILMWPLYQSSMRASLRMQRIQPEIMEAQRRYQNNPQKQQAEMLRIYREHGMTPFSPLMGCLPALIPMPVLIALFFVFQNTIEFRGVSFLWLPDISLKDPYYIVPLVMGGSMFLLSWIGMRNAPPNPQAKIVAYFLPIMMTVFFLNFASGLNLYYAVQNIAALPQQWMIAHERAKAATKPGQSRT